MKYMHVIRGLSIIVVAITLYALLWPAFGFNNSDFSQDRRAFITVSGFVLILIGFGVRETIVGKRK